MYVLNVLTLLTLSATSAFAAPSSSEYQDALSCGAISPHINAAISQFCNHRNAHGDLANDIVVPSSYAVKGVTVNGWKVAIDGGLCKPAQWVPTQYCNSQFHNMCAAQSKLRMYGYGQNKCQIWRITQV